VTRGGNLCAEMGDEHLEGGKVGSVTRGGNLFAEMGDEHLEGGKVGCEIWRELGKFPKLRQAVTMSDTQIFVSKLRNTPRFLCLNSESNHLLFQIMVPNSLQIFSTPFNISPPS
jgi:hypothetical protein